MQSQIKFETSTQRDSAIIDYTSLRFRYRSYTGASNIIASLGRFLDGNKICILITTFRDEVPREF